MLAPVPVAPVNETDMVLLPDGLKALKRVAKEVGVDLRGAYLNLDGGFDSTHNRKCIFNAGLIPNIKENPRNRKTPKRGRKRFFNAAIHSFSVVNLRRPGTQFNTPWCILWFNDVLSRIKKPVSFDLLLSAPEAAAADVRFG